MFRPSSKKAPKSISEINITPLVDVSLVLVIIFMVTVPMLFQPLVDINPARSKSKLAAAARNRNINKFRGFYCCIHPCRYSDWLECRRIIKLRWHYQYG